MARVLPFFIGLVLSVFAVIDCIQTDESRVRGIPKMVWVFVILLFPFAGSIAWLIAGKQRLGVATEPNRGLRWQDHPGTFKPPGSTPGPGRSGLSGPSGPAGSGPSGPAGPPRRDRPIGPDDDPDFLKNL